MLHGHGHGGGHHHDGVGEEPVAHRNPYTLRDQL